MVPAPEPRAIRSARSRPRSATRTTSSSSTTRRWRGSITLQTGQKLYGEGFGLSINQALNGNPAPTVLVAPGNNPVINATTGNAVGVLANTANGSLTNVEIRGLTLSTTAPSSNAIDITSANAADLGVTISDVVVTGATAEGIDINQASTGTATVAISNVTVTSTGHGIDLNETAGTMTVTGFSGITITGDTGGSGIVVTNATFDATAGGGYDQVTGGATAVGDPINPVGLAGVVLTNVSGDLAFTDLDIFSTSGAGLLLSGTGAVNAAAGTGTLVSVAPGVATLQSIGGPVVGVNNATVDLPLDSASVTSSPTTGIILLNVASGTTPASVSATSGSIGNTTGIAVDITGGTVSLNYGGNITKANSFAMVSVSGGHTAGTITFSGTLNATSGPGLVFDNADSTTTYNFTGTTTLNGGDAGIDIINGSSGTFTFVNTTITNPTGSAFFLSDSPATVTYSGSITDNTGFAVDINNHDSGTVVFATGAITSNGTGTGIQVANSNGGVINFNSPTIVLTTGTSKAVTLDVNNGGGAINFNPAVGGTGLDITTTTGTGFSAIGGGLISVEGTGNSITAGTGIALDVLGVTIGAGGLNFGTTTSGGGLRNVRLTSVTGGAIALGTGSLAGAAGAAFLVGDGAGSAGTGGTAAISYGGTITTTGGVRAVDIQDRAAGAGNITLSGTITHAAGNANVIFLDDNAAGTIAFSGPNSVLNGGTSTAVLLTDNTGATVNFSGGGLDIDATSGAGFVATGGGTVTVTGTANSIVTTTGTALNVANTTIGASGITFRSISATGAVNGIVLNNTGATAGLTVIGNAGICASAGTCTGGAIQNTTGDGLALTSTRTVSLTRLFVGTAANHGINANTVNGLTLSNSFVQDNGNGDNEHGLNLVNAAGTVTIDATTFSGASEDLIHLENNNTNVTFTVTNNSQFTYPSVVGAFANSAMLLLPGGTASITAAIQNSTFTNVRNAAAQIGANLLNSNGTQNFTFSNNTLNVTLAGRASGVVVSGQELTTTNLTIANNTFSGAGGNGVISIDTNDGSRVNGTVSGNQITNPPGIGMFVAVDEAATNDIVFDNNTITNSGGDGIQAVNFGGVGVSTMQLAVTNNIVNGHSANTAVNFVGGISFTGFEDTSCLVLRGNTVTGTPASPTQCGGAPCVDYYLEEVGGTMTLEEVPNTAATTANAAYVNSINDPGPVTIFGVIDLTNGATCNVALMADGGERPACNTASVVDPDDLTRLVVAAARLYGKAAGASDRAVATDTMASLGLRLTDLAAGQLGRVAGGHVSLDRDAAGWGWFVDPTPDQDEEFEPASPETGERRAKAGGPADGKIDLLTVLMHEMGHARGEIDVDSVAHPGELMAARLKVGVRRRPPPVEGRRKDGGTIFE